MQAHCTNCNAPLEGDVAFCAECGTKVEAAPQVPQEPQEPQTHQAPQVFPHAYSEVFCPNCGVSATTEFAFCPECGGALEDNQGDQYQPPDFLSETKKSKLPVKPLYIAIAGVAVVLIAAAIIFIPRIFGGGGSSGDHLIFAKERELHFLNMSSMDSFEMTDRLDGGNRDLIGPYEFLSLSSYIFMSENGRYIYYPDRFDERAENFSYFWRDLRGDNTGSDAATRVDSDISIYQTFLNKDGSRFFYIRGDDNRLTVFDRTSDERHRLADDVVSFYVNDAGDYIIYQTYVDGEYFIWEVNLRNLPGERERIESDAYISRAFANEKRVFYVRDDSLFVKDSGSDRERITNDLTHLVAVVDASSVYFLRTEEETSRLSAFVNDDMLSSDGNQTQPSEPNVPSEPRYPQWDDFSLGQQEVWHDAWWGDEQNPDTGEWGYWEYVQVYDEVGYYEAESRYQEEYQRWWEEATQLWDDYNQAMAVYQGRAQRDELRAALNDPENSLTYDRYDLYYWTPDGETTKISEDVAYHGWSFGLARSATQPVVVFQKFGTDGSGGQRMSELVDQWGGYINVNMAIMTLRDNAMWSRRASDDIYVAHGINESRFEAEDATSFTITPNGTIYFLDEYDWDRSRGTLMSAPVTRDALSRPERVDEDVSSFFVGNDSDHVFYFKDVRNDRGDLYLAGNEIASDVLVWGVYNFSESTTLLYYMDWSERNENGTLFINVNGTQTRIAEEVSYFSPLDERSIAFLDNYRTDRGRGDMRLFRMGRDTELVDTDVAMLLWLPKMMWREFNF